jgi:predicted dehydrogenase
MEVHQMVRIGIMSFAHMHAYGYADCIKKLNNAFLLGIADDNAGRGKRAAKELKTRYYDSYKTLLEGDTDAVVITSENKRHKELVKMAAGCGKHILCEKPISTSIRDAEDMINTCRKNNVKLQVAFPCRFASPAIRAKAVIDEGKIGRVLAIKGTNRGKMPGGWFVDRALSGGGAVMDHTVHVVDLMRWILKQEVAEVYAEIDTHFHNISVDDCGLLTMEFGDGTFASLDPSWSRPKKSFPVWGDVTMTIVGTDGILDIDLFGQKLWLFSENDGKTTGIDWGDNMDMGLVEDFVSMIEKNGQPSITGEDGLRAVEVAIAAYESARRRKPVRLPLTQDRKISGVKPGKCGTQGG